MKASGLTKTLLKAGGMRKALPFQGTQEATATGSCRRCGDCCSDAIPISAEEVRQIRDYVQRNGIQPYRGNGPKTAMVNPKIVVDGTKVSEVRCPLRHPTKGCMVYNIRPRICKLFTCWDQAQFARIQEEMANSGNYPVQSIESVIFDMNTN